MGDADFSGLLILTYLCLAVSFLLIVVFLYNLFSKNTSYKKLRPSSVNKFLLISSITFTILLFLKVSIQKKILSIILTLVGLSPFYIFFLFLLFMIYKGSNKARFVYIISLILAILGPIYLIIEYDYYESNPSESSVIIVGSLILFSSIFLLFSKYSSAWFIEH